MSMLQLLPLLSAQTELIIPGTKALAEGLQTAGLATGLALFILISAVLYHRKEKQAEAHAAELKILNATYSLSLQNLADKSRANEESKNDKIVAMVVKVTEALVSSTFSMHELAETIEDIAKRLPRGRS